MKDDFTKNLGITMALILGLLALDRLPDFMRPSQSRTLLGKVIMDTKNDELNREDANALAGGYYEGLRKDAGRFGLPGVALPGVRDDVLFHDDFLRYEFKPNVKRPYPGGMRITNSLGMPNPEYPYQKPPHTRRIALLGDSMSVGPYGHDYEALLEDHLNQADLTPEIQRFQILNFAVYGYSVVQMMDVALEKAPKFHPDVYMVEMGDLEVMGRSGWRSLVGSLLLTGTDLKYDFLRRVVAQAGVQPTDHLATITKKLKPFSLQVIRWAMEQIRDHAASEKAQMIIVLDPAPIDPKLAAADLDYLHQAIDGVGVPVIDLRDTFRSAKLEDIRVPSDIHPNVQGHEMVFENLYAKLRAQPQAWAALIGSVGESPDQTKASSTGIVQLKRTER
jgi:hypothetical protein